MDSFFVWVIPSLIGILYFGLYFLLHKVFKFRMIHSIWLPLAVSAFAWIVGIGAYLDKSNGWGDLIAIAVVVIYNIPVVTFFISLLVYRLVSKEKLLKDKSKLIKV
ncbi:MAG: hypothetical protein WCI62_01840 [Erysipelotrichaceae bacterium]